LYIRHGSGDQCLLDMFEEARKSRMDGLCSDLRIESEEEARRNVLNAGKFLDNLSEIREVRLASAVTRCPECGGMPRKHNERGAGRKRIATKEIMARVTELRGEGLSHAKIAGKLSAEYGIKISRSTVWEIARGEYTPSDAN
jgi:cytochrome c-type biogenesis protein CcmH/NrfF